MSQFSKLLYPTSAEEWIEDQSARFRSPLTRRDYLGTLRLLQSAHPGKRVRAFTEDDLHLFVTAPHLSPNGQLFRRKAITGFYRWATWRNLVDKDPSLGLRYRTEIRSQPVKVHRWLSPPERKALLATCDPDTPIDRRDRVLLTTALLTGLRRSELAAVRWGHLDLDAGSLLVENGKGGKSVIIGVPGQLGEILLDWRHTRQRGGHSSDPDAPVFTSFRVVGEGLGQGQWRQELHKVIPLWDRPLAGKGIYKTVQRRGRQSGVGHVEVHDLRRTFAGMLEDMGKSVDEIAKALRHSNVSTTARYLETNPRRVIQVTEGLTI